MKKILIVIMLLFGIAINGLILLLPVECSQTTMMLRLRIMAEESQSYQFFYTNEGVFTEEKSVRVDYTGMGNEELLEVVIPKETSILRFDFGEKAGKHMLLKFALVYADKEIFNSVEQAATLISEEHMISSANWGEQAVIITSGTDGYVILDLSKAGLEEGMKEAERSFRLQENMKKLVLFDVLFILAFFGFLRFYNYIKVYCLELWQNRKVIFNLSKNDFKIKYAGSYLGIVWAFIQPIVTIAVYWFVFQVGFRSGDVQGNIPYIVWLMTGLIPWFFFVEALSGGTNCLLDYNYLVKKVVFPINILPIIRILATYYIHIFFMLFMFIIYFLYGFTPDIYWFQVIYCELCLGIMLIGLVYATSALVVFFKDLSQIIVIVLQVGLWMTPILWDYRVLIENPLLLYILKLNPVFYIIEQYRNALIYKNWFFENFYYTMYFWMVNIALFGIGTLLFRKLKIHFADVI